jgi:subtilisin family serine protease
VIHPDSIHEIRVMKICCVAVIAFLLSFATHAQYTKHVVEFTDKKGTTHTLADPSTYLSAKSIERRTKQHIPIDSTDLPVSAAYLDSIRSIPNVTVINISKWLNQVLIQTNDAAALNKINSFPFVKSNYEVAPLARPSSQGPVSKKMESELKPVKEQPTARIAAATAINYGNTFNQIHLHDGEYLHDRGFTGRGITIAMLDAGFNSYKTNPAFDSVRLDGRVLGEKDFVTGDGSVNEDDTHGANCFSIIASNRPGLLVGSAPHASFWLLRTENTASEYPVEEQNWAAAAEFADSAGADIISSSLGYIDFDDPAFDHSYAQRNGNTSMITRAADLAASKGMIVMNSAGNNGGFTNDMKFVSCPADGDSVYSVGACDINGNISSGSSWGPNGNGLLKPNGVSVGLGTILANTLGNPVAGNGTSYSCPNLAGLVACLWQAFPEFTNMEILDCVQRSSSRYNDPNQRYGYGIPDFSLAYSLLEAERAKRQGAGILGTKWIKAYPVPFTGGFTIMLKAPVTGRASFQLLDISGRLLETKVLDMNMDQVYILPFSRAIGLPNGVYYVRYNDGKNRETIPVIRR